MEKLQFPPTWKFEEVLLQNDEKLRCDLGGISFKEHFRLYPSARGDQGTEAASLRYRKELSLHTITVLRTEKSEGDWDWQE